MEPKDKAKQLILDFSECGEDNEMYIETARQCALMCINEILNNHPVQNIEYWFDVKQEIKGFDK